MQVSEKIKLIKITAPHGIGGAVKLKYFGENPNNLLTYRCFQDKDGHVFELEQLRIGKVLCAYFSHITTRTEAENLRGTELFIERSQLLDKTLEKEEFFHVDLIGLQVENRQEKVIGIILSVANFGAGDLLEIKLNDQENASCFLPFTKAMVPEVFLKQKKLILSEEGESFLMQR